MTGRVLHGKFEILQEIGRGGMGVVYRARQLSLDRIVALKMLSAKLTEDDEFRERFRQEAKIIARLSHPNIVQVYDIYDIETDGGSVCIIMEYVDGRPLREIAHETGCLPIQKAVDITAQVAAGLAYAHNLGIVHRDIKPDNIMIVADRQVKIMDFGIARLRDSSIQTEPGMTMGTPQFMSPEQAAGKPVDARSDLYSLAVVLYRMVTGGLPFTGDSPIAVALKHIQEPPPAPSEVNPAVPPALEAIILKALAKRPDDRYQSGEEFQKALEDFRDTGKVIAAPDDTEETFISTPALSAAVAGLEEATMSAPPANPVVVSPQPAASAPIAHATPVQFTTPTPQRRFNWPWVVAAVPGLLALALVLAFGFGLFKNNRVTKSDLASAPIETVLRKLDNWETINPRQAHRFIERNEHILYNRISRLLRHEGPTMPGRGVSRLRGLSSSVIARNLRTDEARRRWESLFRQLGARGPRLPGRRREAISRQLMKRPQVEQVFRRLHDDVEQDPDRAQRSFDEATAIFQQLETERQPARRVRLLQERFAKLVDSVRFDRENPRYCLELEKFLSSHAKEFLSAVPDKRIEQEARRLLDQAANRYSAPSLREEILLRRRMYLNRDRFDAMRDWIDEILEGDVAAADFPTSLTRPAQRLPRWRERMAAPPGGVRPKRLGPRGWPPGSFEDNEPGVPGRFRLQHERPWEPPPERRPAPDTERRPPPPDIEP